MEVEDDIAVGVDGDKGNVEDERDETAGDVGGDHALDIDRNRLDSSGKDSSNSEEFNAITGGDDEISTSGVDVRNSCDDNSISEPGCQCDELNANSSVDNIDRFGVDDPDDEDNVTTFGCEAS